MYLIGHSDIGQGFDEIGQRDYPGLWELLEERHNIWNVKSAVGPISIVLRYPLRVGWAKICKYVLGGHGRIRAAPAPFDQ